MPCFYWLWLAVYIYSLLMMLLFWYSRFIFLLVLVFPVGPLSISLSQLHCAPEYQGRLQATFNGLSGIFILAIYLLMAKEGNGLSSQGVYLAQSVLALAGIVIVLFYRKGEHRES
ncbi:Uncharacterised protein [Salmonella enterica subsp. arizonae]|nr:Uncharacterised protein [Salmonella enterica subsp. arizonae]